MAALDRALALAQVHRVAVAVADDLDLDVPRVADIALEVDRRVASSVGYTNAGTIEFLLDASGAFYFLEMNTRLQVEHPITEAVTGIDLVQWQFRLARGERLSIEDEAAATPRGHAIECRIYAEDPDAGFMPSPGTLVRLAPPSGPGVRDDGGYDARGEVPIFYDSLVSKLITWGPTRAGAIARMRRALGEYDISGVRTTIPFFHWLLASPAFLRAEVDTTFLDRELAARNGTPFQPIDDSAEDLAAIAVAVHSLYEDPGTRARADRDSRWTRAARAEALR